MKQLTRFLGYVLSTCIIFYAGAYCFWLEFSSDNPFMNLLWIPLFMAGVLLNIHFARTKTKQEESK